MSLNFSWLDDFLALHASGNFSRAAEERHMTQPAFSRRIRALEEWVGTELFDRSSQPARLTAAGEWFKTAAQDLLSRAARVPAETRAIAEAHSTTLRFASTHALSFTFLTGFLRSLEKRTSVGPITLVSDVFPRCEAMLLAGEVQFVVCHAHDDAVIASGLSAHGYPSARVGTDLLMPVSAPDAVGRPRHAVDGTAPVPLLSYGAQSGIGAIVQKVHGAALEARGVTSVVQASLASVLRTMAVDGRGLAWLPRSLVEDDLAAGRLVPAADPSWSIATEIRLYRDRKPLGAAAESFWQAVLESVQ